MTRPRQTPIHSRHLAVLVFPDFGHVHPTLALTAELVARGHRVTYVVDERFAALVAGAGARALTYRSHRLRLGSTVGADDIAAVGLDFLLETIGTVTPAARAHFAHDLPDAVLYDFESFAAARMLAHHWDRPTVQLTPYLAANEKYSPRRKIFTSEQAALLEGRAALEEFLRVNDRDPAALAEFAAEHDERNLVFVPREFQPEGDTFDDRFAFVGPCGTGGRSGPADWTPPGHGTPVVLASLGTESNGRPEVFRTLAKAFDDGRWHVVMTLGHGTDPARVTGSIPHVEAHEWLPHPWVLPHADAFVCHGGMGSVMEALYFGTPVVVVPHTPEHVITGRRLAELGLGAVLPGEEITASSLRSAVDALAGDAAVVTRLARMRERTRAAGGAGRAATVVEEWLRSC